MDEPGRGNPPGSVTVASVRGPPISPCDHLDQPPGRHQRPHRLQEQEPILAVRCGEHGQHRGPHEIEHEIDARARTEQVELRRREARQDTERARDLDDLIDGARLALECPGPPS